MSIPQREAERQEGPSPLEPPSCSEQPPCLVPPKPSRPARRPKPLPCVEDWEFWRFLMTALNLVWDVVKTFLR